MTRGGADPAEDRPAPSVRRCATAAELVKIRRAAGAPSALARHLVAHLSHPCATCWQAIEKVGRVSRRDDPDGLPLAPEGWEPSADPVVLALRTVGGWPPRRWLRPSHRDALDRVRERTGFLGLVVEECLRVTADDAARLALLSEWLPLVGLVDDTGQVDDADDAARWLHSRGLAYLAQTQAEADTALALATLTKAEEALGDGPPPAALRALHTVTRARIVESHHAQLTRAHLELAADRLAPSSHALRTEIFLDLAEFHLRHGQPQHTAQALGRAAQLLRESDQPLLVERLKLARVGWSLLLAETVTPGLQRLAGHATALGHASLALPIPAQLDAPLSQRRAALRKRLDVARAEHRPDSIWQALSYLGERQDSPDASILIGTSLRVVLAAALLGADDEAARAEVEAIRETFDSRPGLFLSIDQARSPLAGVLESYPEALEVEALVGPVLRVLDLLARPSAKTRDELATVEGSS